MEQILDIIKELKKLSGYEQEPKEELFENSRMLAITKETSQFYNQILKAWPSNQDYWKIQYDDLKL